MTAVPTRRERQRQATFDEIVEVSRRLLREGEDVSVRAVAQEMGLTPPALYRYVDSHADLMMLVARSIFEDVVAAMAVARDAQPDDDPAAQIVAASAAFRAWSLRNRTEFQLVFASGTSIELDEAARLAGRRRRSRRWPTACPTSPGVHLFAAFFSEIFGRLWARYQFPIPTDDELDPALLEILRSEIKPAEVTDALGTPTPGMVWMFERAWARLYGTVTLEVFGHVHPGMISTGALFTATMLDIGADLGITRRVAAAAARGAGRGGAGARHRPDRARVQRGGAEPGQVRWRSNVTSTPSVPPGPIRPLTSTAVMALTCHPFCAHSLSTFSSLSADILPPMSPSRTWTTLYSYMGSA